MDGIRLIHEAHALPKLQALTTTSRADKSKTRSRIVAGLATLVLVGVMAMVYYVSIRQSRHTTTVAISPAVEATQPNAAVSPASASETAVADQTEGSEKRAADVPAEKTANGSRTATDAAAEAKPAPKAETDRAIKPAAQTRNAAGTPAKSEEKDDSKVRSAIKKTGRFFKKALPF